MSEICLTLTQQVFIFIFITSGYVLSLVINHVWSKQCYKVNERWAKLNNDLIQEYYGGKKK